MLEMRGMRGKPGMYRMSGMADKPEMLVKREMARIAGTAGILGVL